MSKQKKEAPKPTRSKKGERKRCKSPRGKKMERTKDMLLGEIDESFRRHRNDYNHHMARVKKLAKLL